MRKRSRYEIWHGIYKIPGREDDGVPRFIYFHCEKCDAEMNSYNGLWLVFSGSGTYLPEISRLVNREMQTNWA